MADSPKTVAENIKLISFILSILGVGVAVGVFSQKLTTVEAKQADQAVQINSLTESYSRTETHLATIDANLSILSKTLLKYDVTVEK